MVLVILLIIAIVVCVYLYKASNEKKYDETSGHKLSFICSEGKCDACKRLLVDEKAYHITADCFYSSIDYDEYCESIDAKMHLDYLVSAMAHNNLDDNGDDNDRKYTICSKCISMFDRNGIVN